MFWAVMIGGSSNGAVRFVDDHVAPHLGEGAVLQLVLVHAAFIVFPSWGLLRAFVCKESGRALGILMLNLLFGAAFAAVALAVVGERG